MTNYSTCWKTENIATQTKKSPAGKGKIFIQYTKKKKNQRLNTSEYIKFLEIRSPYYNIHNGGKKEFYIPALAL